jgi:hypothetical protein
MHKVHGFGGWKDKYGTPCKGSLDLRSSIGGVALKALFGIDVSSETMELKIVGEQDDKLEALSRVVSILEQHITETEGSSVSSCGTKYSLQEVIFHIFGKIIGDLSILNILKFLTSHRKQSKGHQVQCL